MQSMQVFHNRRNVIKTRGIGDEPCGSVLNPFTPECKLYFFCFIKERSSQHPLLMLSWQKIIFISDFISNSLVDIMVPFSLQLAYSCIGIFTSISIVTSGSKKNDIAFQKARRSHFPASGNKCQLWCKLIQFNASILLKVGRKTERTLSNDRQK